MPKVTGIGGGTGLSTLFRGLRNKKLDIHGVNFSTVEYKPSRIDIFLNGVLLRSGSSHDYELTSTGSILLNHSLEVDDTILAITF